jgi:DNA repair exonuclease SbcCD ATPase subunit
VISQITIEGFRGITRECVLRFGDITLISGRNGFGKTTVFEAIDWCLFGSASKTAEEREALRNLYAPLVEPHVEMGVAIDGQRHSIRRTLSAVFFDGALISDRELMETLVTDLDMFPPYARDLDQRLRRLIYLRQDEIRVLLNSASRDEHAAILQSILGIPNAEVVSASIRKIEQRLKERTRDLEEQATEVQQLIADIAGQREPVGRYDEAHIQSVLSTVQQIVGQSTPQPLGLADAADMIRGQLREATARRGELSEFLVADEETRALIQADRNRLKADTAELDTLSAALQAEQSLLKSIETSKESAQQTYQLVTAELAMVEAEASRISHAIERLEALRTLDVQAEEIGKEEEARRGEREQLEQKLARLENEVSTLRVRIDVARAREEDLRQRALAFSELAELFDGMTAVERSIEQTEHDKAIGEQQVGDASSKIAAIETQLADLRRAMSVFVHSDSDRLNTLLAELRALLEGSDLSSCPLCGQGYNTHAELLAKVHKESESRTLLSAEVRRLTDRIARVEQDLLRSRSEKDQVQSAVSGLELSLAVKRDELGLFRGRVEELRRRAPADDPAEAVRTDVSQLIREIDAKNRERIALASEVGRVEAALQLCLEKKATIARSRQELAPTTSSNVPYDALRDQQLQIHQLSVEAVDRRRNAQVALDAIREAERKSVERSLELRARRDGVQARKDARTREVARLEAEQTRRLEETIGSASSAGAEVPLIEHEIERQDQVIEQLRSVLRDVEGALAYVEAESTTSRMEDLNRSRRDLNAKQRALAKAALRFGEVSVALKQVAQAEGHKAVSLAQESIQRLLDALCRHDHLNRVRLIPDPAEILVFDDRVPSGVRPDLYTSTGQLNILALAFIIGTSLHQRALKLRTLLLDEPVQNLDDLHFLGFITIVRRLAATRQVILSTADANIAELFQRQIKSSASRSQTRYVQYDVRAFDWKEGPNFDLAYSTNADV